jgi:hypothetical protein
MREDAMTYRSPVKPKWTPPNEREIARRAALVDRWILSRAFDGKLAVADDAWAYIARAWPRSRLEDRERVYQKCRKAAHTIVLDGIPAPYMRSN